MLSGVWVLCLPWKVSKQTYVCIFYFSRMEVGLVAMQLESSLKQFHSLDGLQSWRGWMFSSNNFLKCSKNLWSFKIPNIRLALFLFGRVFEFWWSWMLTCVFFMIIWINTSDSTELWTADDYWENDNETEANPTQVMQWCN